MQMVLKAEKSGPPVAAGRSCPSRVARAARAQAARPPPASAAPAAAPVLVAVPTQMRGHSASCQP